MEVGIVGYGSSIPRQRIKVEEIAKVWGADAPSYKKGLMLYEKSVPAPDEDVISMSVEAGRRALKRSGGVDPRDIGAILNEMWALRSLERIGDHACNIAENVVYLVRGLDVRHGRLDELGEHIVHKK